MGKLVSVIIPVYNVEKYLSRCLDSVICQTYSDLEILLINDGSTDESGKICDEYAKKDRRIRVIHKKNGGVSSARNIGLRHATGEYVGFIDSDDYISPHMYQCLVDNIEKEKADISIVGFLNEESLNDFVPYWAQKEYRMFSKSEQIDKLLTNTFYTCSCCDKIIKRSLLVDLYFDEKIKQYEDLLFLYQAMKRSEKAVFTSEAYYYYCTNQGSASTVAFNDSMMAIVDVSEKILEDIEEEMSDLISCAKREFVRNNIMCAINAVKSDYRNVISIKRIQNNIKKYLGDYLKSDASKGYKLNAVLIATNWKVFRLYARRYGRKV